MQACLCRKSLLKKLYVADKDSLAGEPEAVEDVSRVRLGKGAGGGKEQDINQVAHRTGLPGTEARRKAILWCPKGVLLRDLVCEGEESIRPVIGDLNEAALRAADAFACG